MKVVCGSLLALAFGGLTIFVLPGIIDPQSKFSLLGAISSTLLCFLGITLTRQASEHNRSPRDDDYFTKKKSSLFAVWLKGAFGASLALVSGYFAVLVFGGALLGYGTDLLLFCQFFIPCSLLCLQGLRMAKPLGTRKWMKNTFCGIAALVLIMPLAIVHDEWRMHGVPVPEFRPVEKHKCAEVILLKMGQRVLSVPRRKIGISYLRQPDGKLLYTAGCNPKSPIEITELDGGVRFHPDQKIGFSFSIRVSPGYGEPFLRVQGLLRKRKLELESLPIKNGYYVYPSPDGDIFISVDNVSPTGNHAVFACPWLNGCGTSAWKDGIRFDLGSIVLDRNNPTEHLREYYQELNLLISSLESD
ncbi:MAG: hypothetical protein ACAH83_17045 [Alphaproteobacteria bacterium]